MTAIKPLPQGALNQRTVSATEAKARFGTVLDWVVKDQTDVIIKSHGEPQGVLIPLDKYAALLELDERHRRQEILDQMRQLRAKTQADNQDLTAEAAEALADRFPREVIAEMIVEGTIQFEE